jgi:hypothetical protein
MVHIGCVLRMVQLRIIKAMRGESHRFDLRSKNQEDSQPWIGYLLLGNIEYKNPRRVVHDCPHLFGFMDNCCLSVRRS